MNNQGTPFSENVKQPTIGGFFIILLIGAMLGFQLGRWSNGYERSSNITPTVKIPPLSPTRTSCTLDAKICPDGSSVGRTGPNCEFAPCPTTSLLPSPTSSVLPTLGICVSAGCSGELCVDKSQADIMSTCEYKEEYTCLKYSRCERQTNGQCGWTQTPEYSQCFSNIKSGFNSE